MKVEKRAHSTIKDTQGDFTLFFDESHSSIQDLRKPEYHNRIFVP
jgi:hypothetical protein